MLSRKKFQKACEMAGLEVTRYTCKRDENGKIKTAYAYVGGWADNERYYYGSNGYVGLDSDFRRKMFQYTGHTVAGVADGLNYIS